MSIQAATGSQLRLPRTWLVLLVVLAFVAISLFLSGWQASSTETGYAPVQMSGMPTPSAGPMA